MKQKCLLLVGVHDGCCDRAHQRGIDFILLQKPQNADGELNRSLDNVLLMDFENSPYIKPIVTAMHQHAPFDQVISITELGLLPAAQMNEYLGLGGTTPEVVKRTRNKWLMRQHLDSIGFPNLKAALVEDKTQLKQFAKQVGYPIIVKPSDGAGSIGIRFFEAPEQIDKCSYEYFKQSLIAEEFADGEEFSVETFSFSGKHIVFGITKKIVSSDNENNPFVEIGHMSPAPLEQADKELINNFIAQFLDIIGITDGLAHTEIKMTSKGIRVIETHNRNGGDHIADLTRLSTGHDLLDYAVAWPTGQIEPLQSSPEAKRGAAILYFQSPNAASIKSMKGMERLRYEPGVVHIEFAVKQGQHVHQLSSSYDRIGFVVACAETAEAALLVCEKVVDEISIKFTS